jgi:hypothetical protein
MVAKNDITGDSIQTKGVSNTYRDNYDLIFGKKGNMKTNNGGITSTDNRSGMTIDWDVADGITKANLLDHFHYLTKEVNDHEKDGSWMHPEDYQNSKVNLLPAFRVILKYYGEDV